jgi:hypothetical protein
MKWNAILIGIVVIAGVMTISTHSVAFADPKHYDIP